MKEQANAAMPALSRRAFVGTAAAAAGVVAATSLAGCSSSGEKKEDEKDNTAADPFADCDTCYACCSPECQHHLLKAYVRDGKVVKVEGGEVNESPACARGFARVEMCNSDQRLTKPLKLVGEKGKGIDQYKEIEWDEAIDLIQEKIQYALDNGGSNTMLYQGGSGNFSSLTGAFSTFIGWLGGGTSTAGNACCAGIDGGLTPVFGKRTQLVRHQIAKSDYIIAWGNNPVNSMTGYFGRFQEMMDNGGTLCTIDPYYSETADKSQEWIQPWPGSDSALSLGMIKVILDEGLQKDDFLKAHTTAPCLIDKATGASFLAKADDETSYQVIDSKTNQIVAHDASDVDPLLTTEGTDFADKYVTEFDLVKAEAAKWDADAVKAETDVDFDDYARIARDYAKAKHGMIIQNMGGYQRTENGSFATAIQCYMALICGHVGHEGDGVYDATGSASLVKSGSAFEANPDAKPNEKKIPVYKFGDYVVDETAGKINFAWITCGNPVAQLPNSNDNWKKGLANIPFVVKVDMFFNSTCMWSDLVLPVTALFETPNVTHSVRSTIIQISEAKVTPPGEAKSDLEITRMVAERFGLDKYFNEDPDVYIKRVIEPAGITLEDLKERKGIDALTEFNPDFIAYKDGEFLTKTKKAQFFNKTWVDAGYEGIACHHRPQESILNGGKYPLASVQRKTRNQVHTTFKNLETMLCMDGHKPTITINAEDAAERGIATGDAVTAFNDRGEHYGVAYVTTHLKKGVVVLENGWDDVWATSSSNLTNNAYPTLGSVHCCNSTMIDVKKGA